MKDHEMKRFEAQSLANRLSLLEARILSLEEQAAPGGFGVGSYVSAIDPKVRLFQNSETGDWWVWAIGCSSPIVIAATAKEAAGLYYALSMKDSR